jgi:flagellar hook-length control protein FliK
MLNRLADLVRLRPSLDEALQRVSPAGPADLAQLPVGTELQARVAAALPNRVYQVVIGERAYTLQLPIDAQPGDEIQLTVVERDTRAPAQLPDRAAPASGGAVTILSPTARFITTLLKAPAPPALTAPAPASRPLLPAPPGETAAVAARLSQALAESGMFYESHQAQWIAGERSLAQLMREPQARVTPLPPVDEPPAATDTAAAPSLAPARTQGPALAPEDPVHPTLRGMVREQLEALSTLQLTWHGQVWPGQDLYWEIAEDAPQRGVANAAAGGWRTRLSLKLPRLGDVHALVSVDASGVGISLAAAESSTTDAMSAGAADLRSALDKAGLRPAKFRIERMKAGHG